MVIRYEDDAGLHVHRHLLTKPRESVTLAVTGRLHWFWPNADDVGFYQADLDTAARTSVLGHAARLKPEEQVALVRDLWFQVRAGQRDASEFLAALERLADGEARYDVVQQIVGFLRSAERLLELAGKPSALQNLRGWVGKRLGPSYRALGPQPRAWETDGTRERRAALLRAMAGIAREPGAIADARALASQERRNPSSVDATVSGAAVAVEAVVGDDKTLDVHLETYKSRRDGHASPQDVERYLYVLPSFRQPKLVQRVLATLKRGTVAPQAMGPILRAMLMEPHSQSPAWGYVKDNWDDIKARLGEAWVANIVEASGELPGNLAPDVVKFYDAKLKGMAGQAYGRAKERLAQNAEFVQRVLPKMERWADSLA